MVMIIKLDDEFRNICSEIVLEDLTELEWRKLWSSDYFQTEHFCGGFDALEKAFVFGYYAANGKQYSFLLKLSEIPDVLSGKITEVDSVSEEE
jgi:hypothetical protein